MKILHFKAEYVFKLAEYYEIRIDPIQRILTDLKTTTLRLKSKPVGNYRVRQGNYMKPCYDSVGHGWHLHIFLLERVSIGMLSIAQIQADLGLEDSEMRQIQEFNPDIHAFFLKGLRTINHNAPISLTDILYLHHFEMVKEKVKPLFEFERSSGVK
jgi:hypothetical protein